MKTLISIGELLDSKLSAAQSQPAPAVIAPTLTSDTPVTPKLPPLKPADTHKASTTGSIKEPVSELLTRHSVTKHQYFVDQAFLTYGDDNVLLDRQVVPFADMQQFKLLNKFTYCRQHILMEAEGDGPGRIVMQNGKNHLGFAQSSLHYRSQQFRSWPNSVAGFLGTHTATTHGPKFESIAPFESMGRWSVFQDQGGEYLASIFPQFYVKAIEPSADSWQMADTTTGEVGWYNHLKGYQPLFVAAHMDWPPEQIKEIEIRLYQEFLFRKIYVGMASVGPTAWRSLGAHRAGPRKLDLSLPYCQRLQQPLPLRGLGIVATWADLSISELFIPLSNPPTHWPERDREQSQDHDDIMVQNMMKEPARSLYRKVLGCADAPSGMVEKSTA